MSAQTSENFSYQAIIRDAAGSLVTETNVAIRLSILKDTETGTVVYSETHNPTTNFSGVVTVLVGNGTVVSGVLNGIEWGTSSYFLKSETDPAGGTSYNTVGTTAILSTPYGLSSKKTDVALSVDYNNLTNRPTTITAEQITKLNFLNVTGTANLDQIESEVAVNTLKTSFPGFGTTAGTAFDIIWSKIDDNLYYDTGKVGIGYTDTSGFGDAILGVKDGMILSLGDTVINPTPGALFYDKSAKGFVFYYDNAGVLQSHGDRSDRF
ncbi:hypothetical protein N7U66_15195 [Lacinutrix neustonica]|uniref:Uncharacterized protein n=1 Tax=Lacinutrix neustonica TaxID=2980107 RepID=A0A9E8MTY2_9FLAO|nr:hypothetical protein [Lacinutrix neustonica]WAC01388.1 hypothetical protein N7U66_15195 [Lacinutrix neustonica]